MMPDKCMKNKLKILGWLLSFVLCFCLCVSYFLYLIFAYLFGLFVYFSSLLFFLSDFLAFPLIHFVTQTYEQETNYKHFRPISRTHFLPPAWQCNSRMHSKPKHCNLQSWSSVGFKLCRLHSHAVPHTYYLHAVESFLTSWQSHESCQL